MWFVVLLFFIFLTGTTTQKLKPLEYDYDEYDFFEDKKCALPVPPRLDTSVSPNDGTRYGNTVHSRQEFVRPVSFMDTITYKSRFALEFKTSFSGSSVLFYVSEANQSFEKSYYERGNDISFIALLLQNGKIVYMFNCGSGNAIITSSETYNDGIWHRVVFTRQGKRGLLLIDNLEFRYGSSHGLANTVNVVAPFYVGGLNNQAFREAKDNLQDIVQSFPGCIRNVEAQNELLTSQNSSLAQNVTGCSNLVEEGNYFSNEGGYIKLYDKYNVGQEINIFMEIKPRNIYGILLAVHGPEHYLILQLINGEIVIEVDNGEGPINTKMRLLPDYLCDGQWHTLEVNKKNNSVSIYLKGKGFSSGSRLRGGGTFTDTNDPLYIGGLPKSSLSKKGVRTTQQFVGCIRNLKLNNESQSFARSTVFGQVTLNTCPTI